MTNRIKAPLGKVILAYMIDINPFHRGLVRRVLIDHHGMVFVPGYAWSNLQDDYKFICLPRPVDMWWGIHNRLIFISMLVGPMRIVLML